VGARSIALENNNLLMAWDVAKGRAPQAVEVAVPEVSSGEQGVEDKSTSSASLNARCSAKYSATPGPRVAAAEARAEKKMQCHMGYGTQNFM
jgi:hypothetical protein